MIGAKDVAFPRLNLMSFYIYVLGALFFLYSIVAGAVDTGWTFYTPYSSQSGTAVTAVTLGAFGGIYLGGGVLPKMGEVFDADRFRERFLAKGATWAAVAIRASRANVAEVADVVRSVVGNNATACRDGKAILLVLGQPLGPAQAVAGELVNRLGQGTFIGVAESANNTWDEAATVAEDLACNLARRAYRL